jgi:hypothetical protein
MHLTCPVDWVGARSKVLTFNFPTRRDGFGD